MRLLEPGNGATRGFLRHAEIDGRVAMFASAPRRAGQRRAHAPGRLLDRSPPGAEEQWFNLPVEGRAQIIGFIGFLEFWGEYGGKHYMRGGRPGEYPTFEEIPAGFVPFPKLNLYDPFGIAAKDSADKKAKGLLAEINNGRLAMIGIMGFVSESHLTGSVPALTGLVKPFAGDVMAPLA